MLFNAVIFGCLLALSEAEFKCHRKIDLAILLDSSASVGENKFNATKKFAADLVRHFDISNDRTSVALISFSQYVHTKKKFLDDTSQDSVLRAIDVLPYEGSFTRLDIALQTLQDETFNKAQGARSYDKAVKKVVVLVTDGFSSLGIETTKKLTDGMKTKGFKLFTVGTSDRLHRFFKAELDELASKPRETHQLIVDLDKNSFTKDQVERLAKEICTTS